MLLYRHQLDNIVPVLNDPVQVVIGKLSVSAHSSLLLGHAYMSLVDLITLVWGIKRLLVLPLVRLRWVPPDTIVQERLFVLNLIS